LAPSPQVPPKRRARSGGPGKDRRQNLLRRLETYRRQRIRHWMVAGLLGVEAAERGLCPRLGPKAKPTPKIGAVYIRPSGVRGQGVRLKHLPPQNAEFWAHWGWFQCDRLSRSSTNGPPLKLFAIGQAACQRPAPLVSRPPLRLTTMPQLEHITASGDMSRIFPAGCRDFGTSTVSIHFGEKETVIPGSARRCQSRVSA